MNLPILILGVGNILLHDEGIGPRVIQEILQHPLPPGVEAIDGGTGGADLVDVIADRQKVIVVDAVRSDLPPGTVLRFTDADMLEKPASATSLHELGLAETLMITRKLNCAPKKVVIFGIVPQTLSPPGIELTPKIEALIPRLVRVVMEEAKEQ